MVRARRLLGSAAGLCLVVGAQAAELPSRKAASVEYVRVCTAYGEGFFYIPGTDTCLRIGGRARYEYQYTSNRTASADVSGYRTTGRLSLDARTETPYGTVRTFVRTEVASRTGAYLYSGTQLRFANSFPGLGQDTFGHVQKFVELDKAFVQFGGLTAGRAVSFYDFYAHDLEYVGSSISSDVASTNLLAYTATFGDGFSATLSLEDPTFRRNPIYSPIGFLTGASSTGGQPMGASNVFVGGPATTAIATAIDPATGYPTRAANLDVAQTNNMPDVIGVLRYEAPWGIAQLSAAVHELRTGRFTGSVFTTDYGFKTGIAGTPLSGISSAAVTAPRPDAEYGYAVQGGLKFNLPQIAKGDVLWLQGAYAKGAGSYTGVYVPQGSDVNTNVYTNRSAYAGYDMVVDSYGGTHLTTSWSVTTAFQHFWAPEIRQAVFATYGEHLNDRAVRGVQSPATPYGLYYATLLPGISNAATSAFSPIGRSWNNLYVGSNLTWSPIRDLDLGVEALYERLAFNNGKVLDMNKGFVIPVGSPNAGVPTKLIAVDDNVLVRLRVQRDF